MQNRMIRNAPRGFTLLEMMIVIGIILLLAGLVAYNLIGTQEKAEEDTVRVQISTMVNALQTFRVEMKRWPTEEEGLAVLWSQDALGDEEDSSKWRKLLDSPVPKDQFGHDWVFHAPSELVDGEPFDIVSVGRDGEEGTADDITNHSLRASAGESEDSAPSGLTPVNRGN